MKNIWVAIRHLKSDKVNSAINLSGLVLGLGVVAVVLVFVLNELGYNHSFEKGDRIYRVLNENNVDHTVWANTPYVLGDVLPEKFAEVENVARQYHISQIEIQKGTHFVNEENLLCTETSFFDLFGVSVLQGSLSGFDQAGGKILLSETMAAKYFGKSQAVGQILTLRSQGTEYPLEVAAIYQDLPQNSSLKASLIANLDFGIEHLKKTLFSVGDFKPDMNYKESWEFGLFFTNYILLKQGVSVNNFEKKLQQLGAEHSTEDNALAFAVQPLYEMYFGSGKISDNNRTESGNLPMLYIMMTVGVLILVIACINYLNLTSAQTLSQTRTMAVKKVCGAGKRGLMGQMILESVTVSLIALPFALLLAGITLPYVSSLFGKSYALNLSHQFLISLGILALITLLTGSISGWLVSLKITSFPLIETLKGHYSPAGKKQTLRKAMVVFQISVFIVLIAVMILAQKQVQYAFSKDLGFVKEGLIRVSAGDQNYDLFKEKIKENSDILAVSGALWVPPHRSKMNMSIPKVDEPDKMVTVNGDFADYHFAETMGLKILRGSDFDEKLHTSGVLVNESLISVLGLKEVIGEETAFGTVVGVVSDFNMYSIHEVIPPMIIGLNPWMHREIAIRIKTENLQHTLDYLKKTWESTGASTPFGFEFTEDILKNMYASDIRFSKMIGMMAFVAILIASLGLFGLSLLISRQKTKEIGIRKVNGAKISEVMTLLNKDFVICVGISFAAATPIAWWTMHTWLESFAYRTSLSWWIFALSGVLALGIALLTVSWQSWKAATRNPVEALRYE